MKKRLLAVFLAVVMTVGVIPFGSIAAFADDADQPDINTEDVIDAEVTVEMSDTEGLEAENEAEADEAEPETAEAETAIAFEAVRLSMDENAPDNDLDIIPEFYTVRDYDESDKTGSLFSFEDMNGAEMFRVYGQYGSLIGFFSCDDSASCVNTDASVTKAEDEMLLNTDEDLEPVCEELTEPEAAESDAEMPETAEPETAELVIAEPETAEPEIAEPVTAEPVIEASLTAVKPGTDVVRPLATGAGTPTIGGINDAVAMIGYPYIFTDGITWTYSDSSTWEEGEQYRLCVTGVDTPAGGSYTFSAGDTSFTPTAQDAALIYTVHYEIQRSEDNGASWSSLVPACTAKKNIICYVVSQNKDKLETDDGYLTSFSIDEMWTGTMPFDADDEPGNDSGKYNNVVRSFDSVTYTLGYSGMVYSTATAYKQIVVHFKAVLPLPANEAAFETNDVSGGGVFPEDTVWSLSTDTNGYQTLYWSETLKGVDGKNVLPGGSTTKVKVNVYAMENGSQVQPTFYAWLDHNDVDENGDETQVCSAHSNAANGGHEMLKCVPEAANVSAAPSYNIVLTSNKNSAMGTFDFSTGNDLAIDKDQGQRYGRIHTYGLVIQLYNKDVTKGLKGIELPAGPIDFDITFENIKFGNTSLMGMEEYAPLIWSYGPNERKVKQIDERDMSRFAEDYAEGIVPFNHNKDGYTIAKDGYVARGKGNGYCWNGGTWSAERVGDITDYTIHFTVSDYEINHKWLADATAADTTSVYKENIGCFSAGEIFVFYPFGDGDKYLPNVYGDDTLYAEIRDMNLDMTSVTGQPQKDSAGTNDKQANTKDDFHARSVSLLKGEGGFANYIAYGNYSVVSCIYPSQYDVDGVHGSPGHGRDGGDALALGAQFRLCWGAYNVPNGEIDNAATAVDSLIKFDPAMVEIDTSMKQLVWYKSNDTVLYAAKPDGTSWTDDAEMNGALIEDLVYYSSLSELESDGKICVGMIGQYRNPENISVEETTHYFNIYCHVKNDISLIGNVYPICIVTNVWRHVGTGTNTVPTLAGAATYPAGSDSPYTKDFLDAYRAGLAIDDARADYTKAKWDPVNGYIGGDTGGRDKGDSLYIVPYKMQVQKTIAQSNNAGSGKTNFDLDMHQYYVDYQIRPWMEVQENVTWNNPTTITLTDTLPAGLTYKTGSAVWGGTYVTASSDGTAPGTVNGGTYIEPQITKNSDGTATLVWVISDVSVGRDIGSLYFTAIIASDIENGTQFENKVAAKSIEDATKPQAAYGNYSTTTFTALRKKEVSVVKTALTTVFDVAGKTTYTLHWNNNGSNLLSKQIMMDTMPYNGDSRGSMFSGTYTIDSLKVTLPSLSSSCTESYTFWYTTDAAAKDITTGDIITGHGENADKITSGAQAPTGVSWTQLGDTLTPGQENNISIPGSGVTAWVICGPIEAGTSVKAEITLSTANNKAGDRYVNRASIDNNLFVDAESYVVSRMLRGTVWEDSDLNGQRAASEPRIAGVTVTLCDEDGDPISDRNGKPLTTVTDADGNYLFTDIPAGTVTVVFTSGKTKLGEYKATVTNAAGVDPSVNSDAVPEYKDDKLVKGVISGIVMPEVEDIVISPYVVYYQDMGLYMLGDLTISKAVTGTGADKTKEFSFKVTLSDKTISGTYGNLTFEKGEASFKLKDGESVTAKGLPKGVSYSVTETDYSSVGYTSSSTGASGKIKGNETVTAEFTNNYKPVPTSIVLGGTKTFSGLPADSTVAPKFTFTLSENGGTIDTATVTKSGEYSFKEIEYEVPGVHTYVVTEIKGNQAGVTYSKKSYEVTVTVSDDGSGNLEAVVSGDSTTGTDLDFENIYKADPTSITLGGTKTFTGFPADSTVAPVFTFTLSENGEAIDTATVTKSGEYSFKEITYDEIGVHTYTVTEVKGTQDGVTYSDESYEITVTVTDDGSGKLKATVSGDSTTGTDLDFENIYMAAPTSIVLGGTKTFTGFPADSQIAPVFTFTLSEDGEAIDTATVTKSGAYSFEEITYDDIGEYTYTVTETKGTQDGVTYSDKSYEVTVTVTDDGSGKLKAVVSGDSTTGTDLDFENIYKADPTSVTFSGTKTLTGKTLEADEFSFTLTGKEDGVSETVKNDAAGAISFSEIIYTKAGTYTYTVKEEATNEAGVTVDSTVYNITVTVTDDGSGKLKATVSGDSTTGDDLDFENVFTSGSLTISKTVTGKLGDKTKFFSFKVEFDVDGTFSYSGSIRGTIRSGDTVRLKHGESITITGIPAGAAYTVTESDNSGYKVNASGDKGIIKAGKTVTAKFTNTKSDVPNTGDTGNMPLWLSLMGVSAVGMLGSVIPGRKKRKKDDC